MFINLFTFRHPDLFFIFYVMCLFSRKAGRDRCQGKMGSVKIDRMVGLKYNLLVYEF